ncbi:TetR family transcriptional regulator [Gordoniibacillus kamchatkensis]|uniref:TetR family transcriptional regulator n=1 Tax=Gordoniibacillus kamchatkensis TaxID=1590651 RepID=A0ABR5AMC0_9BACL|nr:TetR/AcrR family transcriptional regulator [Paenibacillus sp. VKM B-2647]KIL42023.1 TetR family transcriptional regulator [Paenibacillus sp. VKM B-2647]
MAKPNVVTKPELLKAAQQCLAERGIEKTTLKAVAEQANVSQGTVFYHFRTKEQLMIELVQSLCDSSWQSLQKNHARIEEALLSAQERCSYNSTYHRLFFASLAASLQSEPNRQQLGSMIRQENKHLTELLASRWGSSPVDLISLDHWGILMNALIDGLAVQALLDEEFPKEAVFDALRALFDFISNGVDK